ncbi:hypothetical protein LTR94_031087, partial [Friedmanniomyces endolithicus]
IVGHLRHIDETLATVVAGGLGLPELPEPAQAAVATRTDLPPSPALSIVARGPESFSGRKLGILVSDEAPSKLLKALVAGVEAAGATFEIIAPKIAGARLDDGSMVEAKQKIDGGPSVLYDAVALLLAPDAAAQLALDKTAKDFVSDAFAHAKFIGYTEDALPLIDAAGISENDMDEGLIALTDAKSIAGFLKNCASL